MTDDQGGLAAQFAEWRHYVQRRRELRQALPEQALVGGRGLPRRLEHVVRAALAVRV